MLNFKNKEYCNKLMEQIRPMIPFFFFLNSVVIMNLDKHSTWSKVSLKQIELRLGTYSLIYHS